MSGIRAIASTTMFLTLCACAPSFADRYYDDNDVRQPPGRYRDYDVVARPMDLCPPYTVVERDCGRYETHTYTVEVAPARCVERWVPAEVRTVYDVCGRPCYDVVVKPAYCVREIIPPVYQTRTMRVRVAPQWQTYEAPSPCATVHRAPPPGQPYVAPLCCK